ncbi:MAG TPA: formylmethanofuran dehydrogenase [Firmicutes bacterium]|jgi:formylmethanofuran dehydrogenase subunit E|nr:formylmethanofuran dehydrogenase [Bacillota bacterium]
MGNEKTLWEQAVAFHGHECTGLATGFRVAEAAINALQSERDIDEEMVAIVENDSCAIDAIQVITGCTFGKGNLIFHDYGKQAYTFILRKNGKAVRIAPIKRDKEKQKDLTALRKKVFSGKANEEEISLYRKKVKAAIGEMLSMPLDEFCRVEEINCEIPEKARIYNSVICSYCGETVMEPRARILNGKLACIPCLEKHTP